MDVNEDIFLVKMQKKKKKCGGGEGRVVWSQGGCERISEVIVKKKKIKGDGQVRCDLKIEEFKFL